VSYADLFSGHARQYAAARPRYPEALFEWLASAAPRHQLAWDCATGNGQAAIGLATRFAHVMATDASEAQLAHAEPHPRIVYRQAAAEASGLDTGSADVVTVAQALHWLDVPAFFDEVRRVLAPAGVLAVWSYALPRITPAIDAEVGRLCRETLKHYWADRRWLVEEGYASIAMPFEALEAPHLELLESWTLTQFSAYLRTWSAVQRFLADRGRDPVDAVEYALRPFWGEAHEKREVRWTLAIRAARS
jgi:SAM-dependent methyltransferase